MNLRLLAIGFLLATVPLPAQKQKNPPPPKNQPASKVAPKGGGAKAFPKAPSGKALTKAERQQRLVDRFNAMSPEQRKNVLDKMTPERRNQVEANLRQYNRLSGEEKNRLRNQYENFQHLPAEKQQEARTVFRRMNQLPDDRRLAVRDEINKLNRLPESERSDRLNNPEFKQSYTPQERRMINEMTRIFSKE